MGRWRADSWCLEKRHWGLVRRRASGWLGCRRAKVPGGRSLEGRGFGGLESGALGPGGAPGEAAGSGSLEGGCLAWALEGSRFDKLEGEELGPGGALGPGSLEGDGVAWSLEGDVRP